MSVGREIKFLRGYVAAAESFVMYKGRSKGFWCWKSGWSHTVVQGDWWCKDGYAGGSGNLHSQIDRLRLPVKTAGFSPCIGVLVVLIAVSRCRQTWDDSGRMF
jgi:hypothetical protein